MPYAEREGARIYWEAQGEGEPLLLIHGLGYTHDMWFRLVPTLAERYRTITYDNRGLGLSDYTPGPYLVPDMAEDAFAVLDAAGVDSAHVMGGSLGALYAMEMALSRPARVRSLILGGATAPGPSFVPAEPELYAAGAARATMAPAEGVRALIPFTYDPETPRERIEEDLAVRLAHYPTPEGYAAQVAWVGTYENEARVGAIKAPTLVIHGETDRFVPVANGRNLASWIPGARLEVLPHASHIFFTDQTDLTLKAMLDFLASMDRAAAGAPEA